MLRPDQTARASAAAWVLCLLLTTGAGGGQGLAIVGATVINCTGAAPLADAIVLVEGDRIKALGPRARVPLPKGVRLIDGRGRFVVPGVLADPAAAREARLLATQGKAPLQAIATVTRRLGAGRPESGVLEPGERADLLILGKDPLVNIRNLATVLTRIKEGKELAPTAER